MKILTEEEKEELQVRFEVLIADYGFTNGVFILNDLPLDATRGVSSFYFGTTKKVMGKMHQAIINLKMSLGIIGKEII